MLGALTVTWQGGTGRSTSSRTPTGASGRSTVKERPAVGEGDVGHLAVVLWTPIPTQGMIPAKRMLIMDGVEFRPVERGTAAFRSEGVTGFPDRGLLDFADYRARDGGCSPSSGAGPAVGRVLRPAAAPRERSP